MDLTPLITNPAQSVQSYVQGAIDRFAGEVAGRLAKLQ
jgi:hypothetical protein